MGVQISVNDGVRFVSLSLFIYLYIKGILKSVYLSRVIYICLYNDFNPYILTMCQTST